MTDNLTELKCSETFKKMLDKYKDNEYMTQRIYNHIVNYLPTTLENEFKNHEKRINRTNFLTNEQNIFSQSENMLSNDLKHKSINIKNILSLNALLPKSNLVESEILDLTQLNSKTLEYLKNLAKNKIFICVSAG